MPLPPAATLVTVHGQILAADGTPATGRITFRMPYPLRDTAGDVIIGPQVTSATLDEDGEFTVELIATDDPDLTPTSWTYTVQVSANVWRDSFNIEVPYDTVGVLELADIAPAVTPPAVATYILASTLGQAGGVASLDADGHVPAVQLDLDAADIGADPAGTAAETVSAHSIETENVHGIADTSQLVLTDDSRLSDARTPTAHAASHADGGSDEITIAQSQVTGLSEDLGAKADAGDLSGHVEATTSVHGISDTSDLVYTNDSRLTDARTPTAHASSHASDGSDPLSPDDIGLDQVDNTADTDKPVSTAQTTAIQGVFSRTSSSFSGPVNINFAANNTYDRHRHLDATVSAFSGTTTITLQTTNARAGDVRSLRLEVNAGAGTIEFRNATSGGTLLGTLPAGGGTFRIWTTYSGSLWQPVQILREDIQAQVNGKVTASTAEHIVYGTTTGGAVLNREVSTIASADTVAVRTDAQQLRALTVADGSEDAATTDLANRDYVSGKLSGKADSSHTHTIRKMIMFGDDRPVLTTGSGSMRWYNREGVTLTIVGVWAAAGTAPTDADIIVDVHKDGTTIFTTQGNRPTVADGTHGGAISATPDVTSLSAGEYLTVDIDQVGSTIAGGHLSVGVVVTYAG